MALVVVLLVVTWPRLPTAPLDAPAPAPMDVCMPRQLAALVLVSRCSGQLVKITAILTQNGLLFSSKARCLPAGRLSLSLDMPSRVLLTVHRVHRVAQLHYCVLMQVTLATLM
jgi:hypothetical protein